MTKKQYTTVLLLLNICFTSLLYGNNCINEDWGFNATATGNTTGHIGNLVITNNTNKANTFWLTSYVIPSKNGQQAYAVFKEKKEQIYIKAGNSYFHQLYGYCININRPPVAEKEVLPNYLEWFPAKEVNATGTERNNQPQSNRVTFNFDTQLEQAAPIILEAVSKLEENYYDWKSPLQIPDLYPANANLVKEAIIQQAVWQFTAALQGKLYTFNQFEQSIVEQKPVNDWLTLNGEKDVIVDDKVFTNKTYFNYQCQKLWSIILSLNFYINSNSRKLIPKWESKTDKLEEKDIEFQELWESVALTGYQFKSKEESKAIPVKKEKTVNSKKILTYASAAIGTAGIITGVVLLANNKKGCTDKLACNYNEDANKDDGSCEYGNDNCANPCMPVAGCLNETACNYNPGACVDDGSCEYPNLDCADPCIAVLGCIDETACNYNPNACVDDGSCATDLCDERCLKKGVIRFNDCGVDQNGNVDPNYFLIEFEGKLLDPFYEDCFYGYDGQEILFNYKVLTHPEIDLINENETVFTCDGRAIPVRLHCLITEPVCNLQTGQLVAYNTCEGREFIRIEILTETVDTTILIAAVHCDFFNETRYETGQLFKLDVEKSNLKYTCSSQAALNDAYVITCIELENVVQTSPGKTLHLLSENQLITLPTQTPEHIEETIITNIIGINYYQPLSPTVFIQNQTSAGYAETSDTHFLNNRITLNTKNPYLPLHYGLGFNTTQLANLSSLNGWQNQLIWNAGIKLPIFNKLQLQAEVYKTFHIDDAPNCNIRIIYQQSKPQKMEKTL